MSRTLLAYLLISIAFPVSANTHRSASIRNHFKQIHPCPATGARNGPCPGYVIDHVKALACGGADSPENMQWQTIAEGKAKDRWERIGCATRFGSHSSKR